MMKKIYLYLLDTMADWESGYLLQGLSMQNMLPEEKYRLCTVALTKREIKTAGGVTIIPDESIDEMKPDEVAALLLIGADNWLDKKQQKVLNMASRLLAKDVPVAAICNATLGLANRGELDTRAHTSNSPSYLTENSQYYKGAAHYSTEPAVADGNLITASAAGSLLWARYIMERLELYTPETLDVWYRYFSTGNADLFASLMQTFQK